MQRQDRPQFFSTPQRITTDTESIELASNQIANESHIASDANRRCYATEYGCMPCETLCAEVHEELEEISSRLTTIENCPPVCCESASIYCAAPIAFLVAGVITPFAFFGGAARDAYEAIKRQCEISPESDTPEASASM